MLFTLLACKKKNNEENDYDHSVLRDFALLNSLSNDAQNTGEEGLARSVEEPSGKRSKIGLYTNCAKITMDRVWPDTIFPRTITVDFGTGCFGADNRYRKGKLTIFATGRYRDVGSVITVSTEDYYVDNIKVDGTKVITNKGLNRNKQMHYEVDLVNYVITRQDNKTIRYNGKHNRTWLEGFETNLYTDGIQGVRDDVYSININGSGVSANGRSFTSKSLKDLIARNDCSYITEGILEVTPSNGNARKLDWGNGNCDNLATFSLGSYSTVIQLR